MEESICMSEIISLEGQVEIWNGQLALRIPLKFGGEGLLNYTRGIGESDGEFLNVVIKPWLAEKLRILDGSFVYVDNRGGKFNITRSEKNDYPPKDEK